MRKKLVIFLSICYSVILSSCGKCIETHLTIHEKEWFCVYKKNQNIIFKSNLNHLDTIVVTEKIETHNNMDCNYYGIGPMQPHVMYITLNSKICHNESYCDGGIFISKDQADKIFFPSFRLFGLYYSKINPEILDKEEWLILNTSQKKYSHVYIFEDGINAKNFGNNYLKSFYWDKKEGLIRYDTSEGEVFELLKKY